MRPRVMSRWCCGTQRPGGAAAMVVERCTYVSYVPVWVKRMLSRCERDRIISRGETTDSWHMPRLAQGCWPSYLCHPIEYITVACTPWMMTLMTTPLLKVPSLTRMA